jgi:hypothetical protein
MGSMQALAGRGKQGVCYCCLALTVARCLAMELPLCPLAAPVYNRRQPLRFASSAESYRER